MQTYVVTTAVFCNMLINREVNIILKNASTGMFITSGKAAEIEFSKYATSPIAFIDIDCDGNFYALFILNEEAE